MVGDSLGPYRVLEKLGAGGMGEVYRARDTRLDRDVAIKVLPSATAHDAEHLGRFTREARAISRLSHPHICTLFDIGEDHGRTFLVMELVAGETLSRRLQGGALPLDLAIRIGSEIASALHAAHTQGIVHRDLKPGNIMLTPATAGSAGSPQAKLLDFGLAKWHEPSGGGDPTAAVADATAPGTILGTLQYMAPEQLEGRPVDARADLFAAGVVLYEMVTGRKAFVGPTQATVIGAILRDQPAPITQFQPSTPPSLERVIQICLAKNREERWQSAADLQKALSLTTVERPAAPPLARGRWGASALWLTVGASLVAAAWLVHSWLPSAPAPSRPSIHVEVPIAPAEVVLGSLLDEPVQGFLRPSRRALALSSDGRTLVYSGQRANQVELYVRALGQDAATTVAGTVGAESPFFSPDDKWIGYWQDGQLKKWALAGGAPSNVCPTPRINGATWLRDGTIVFAAQRIFRCPDTGGTPEPLFTPDPAAGEIDYRLPAALPGDHVIMYTVSTGTGASDLRLVARPLAGGPAHAVVDDASDGRYVDTGHLVFARAGALFAAPFDPARAVTTGGAVSVLTDVMHAPGARLDRLRTSAAQMAVSASGDLAYLSGGVSPDRIGIPAWIEGDRVSPIGVKGSYLRTRISPDGSRILTLGLGKDDGIWVHRLADGTRLRVPFNGSLQQNAEWISDSTLAFSGMVRGVTNIYRAPADGSAAAERLTSGTSAQIITSVSHDGSELLFIQDGDIWLLPLPTGTPRRLLETPEFEASATLSPDREWLAYEAGNEVRVQPFPSLSARYAVWPGFSRHPWWSRDGRHFFFTTLSGTTFSLIRAEARVAGDFTAANPQTIWSSDMSAFRGGLMTRFYDVDPAGRRLLINTLDPPVLAPARVIRLVVNWFDELRARVAAAR